MVLVNTSVGVTNLFIYCYFGKLATESYEKMTDYLVQSNWYEHPNNLQKYLILIIANTQTPVVYHGFNIAVLDLQTFSKVISYNYLLGEKKRQHLERGKIKQFFSILQMIKATYSFYMMFKTMN